MWQHEMDLQRVTLHISLPAWMAGSSSAGFRTGETRPSQNGVWSPRPAGVSVQPIPLNAPFKSQHSFALRDEGCGCKGPGSGVLFNLLVKASDGFFAPSEASEIMKSIGEAIQYLHSINIAHRDVKVPP